jgi:hypothetical protein
MSATRFASAAPGADPDSADRGLGTAPIAEDLLARVLEPYSYKGCRYLLDADYAATTGSMRAQANFSIAAPAYIRSTGHFNAVEAVLCFNQLFYSTLAQGVLNEDIGELVGWSIEDFYQNQLPGILIKNTSSRFKRPIDARKLSARLLVCDFQIVERTRRYLQLESFVEFWDQDGGAAHGEFELAVLNIP